jgi:hypothetical protein
MGYYQGQLEGAWGVPLVVIFHAMGGELSDKDQVDFLYYAMMGCFGHGVGLWDDWGDRLDKASLALGGTLDPAPIFGESMEMDEIAEDYVAKHGIQNLEKRD